MPRYIDGSEIKLKIRDRIFLDAEFFDGTKFESLEPHRLFPVSGLTKYIALTDSEGDSVCIINNIDDLLPESREALTGALNEYYMIPKIQKVIKREEKQGAFVWTVQTPHGKVTFEIHDIINHIIRLYDDRILIKDSSDNRYEIPDLKKLDARSQKLILPDV